MANSSEATLARLALAGLVFLFAGSCASGTATPNASPAASSVESSFTIPTPGGAGYLVYIDTGRLCFMPARGGSQTCYPGNGGVLASALQPAWSPDGQEIAFAHVGLPGTPAGAIPFGLLVLEGNGTVRRLTTSPTVISGQPSWSPDGSKIAFTETVGAGTSVFVINSDGTGLRRLTTSDQAWGPSWSPNGSKIAFAQTLPGSHAFGRYGIFTTRSDGAGPPTRIAEASGNLVNILTSPAVRWSPAGQWIAYVNTSLGGNSQIWIVPESGGAARLVGLGSSPSWSPDGSSMVITLQAAGSNQTEFATVQPRGGDLVKIAEGVGGEPSWGP